MCGIFFYSMKSIKKNVVDWILCPICLRYACLCSPPCQTICHVSRRHNAFSFAIATYLRRSDCQWPGQCRPRGCVDSPTKCLCPNWPGSNACRLLWHGNAIHQQVYNRQVTIYIRTIVHKCKYRSILNQLLLRSTHYFLGYKV